MRIKLEIVDGQGRIKALAEDEGEVALMWDGAYEPGDAIRLRAEGQCDLRIYLDETLGYALVRYVRPFVLKVPFGLAKSSYSPRSFCDGRKFYRVRTAGPREIHNYRNLACNPYDHHQNEGVFPHSEANVETRNESVFASRNAIDGVVANNNHGRFPFQSWGINKNPDAEMRVDFGRDVRIDKVVFYNRADFPHDAWWKEATVAFSDGSSERFGFLKTGKAQPFRVKERIISSLTIKELVKADDPSPFPALTQIEVWGSDV